MQRIRGLGHEALYKLTFYTICYTTLFAVYTCPSMFAESSSFSPFGGCNTKKDLWSETSSHHFAVGDSSTNSLVYYSEQLHLLYYN